jgi:anti-anti-sigma regulatory factor
MEPTANLDRANADRASHASRPTSSQSDSSIPTVIQPYALSGVDGQTFQVSLDQAMQSGAAVIVDLLWIKDIQSEGLNILLTAMQQAQAVGVSLLFQSMDQATRNQLDDLWEQRRDMGIHHDLFAPDFENFLASFQSTKEAALRAFEMSSKTQW